LKRFNTTKLFWGEFLYKLEVRNRMATQFRERNLSAVRQMLDSLQLSYVNGEKLEVLVGARATPLTEEQFLDATSLYKHFNKSKNVNYKLRVESNIINIYSNDIEWIDDIIKLISSNNITSFYSPNKDSFAILDKNTIIVKESNGYNYKVTLSNKSNDNSFVNWAKNNISQVKLGAKLTQQLLGNGWVDGYYFYARDERTVQLCTLMLNNIRRVDKLVVQSNIDK
tara:strand:- start:984 stop:1658 length:675 start_codon:yes stop_codon:yes gene_type:complete